MCVLLLTEDLMKIQQVKADSRMCSPTIKCVLLLTEDLMKIQQVEARLTVYMEKVNTSP